MAKITVCICSKDREYLLRKCLKHLQGEHNNIDRLIIIEDTSHHHFFDLSKVKKIFSNTTVKLEYYPVQFCNISRSRQLALSLVKEGLLLFVDDDVIVSSNSLQKVKDFFKANKKAALLTGKMLPVQKKSLVSEIDYIYFSQAILPFKKTTSINLCPFSFVALNIDVLKKYPAKKIAFDSIFRIGEDIDFTLQLSRHTFELFYNPTLINYHHYDHSIFNFLIKKYLHGKYIYLLYQKHTDTFLESNAIPSDEKNLLSFLFIRSWYLMKYYAQMHSFSFLQKIIIYAGEIAMAAGMIRVHRLGLESLEKTRDRPRMFKE